MRHFFERLESRRLCAAGDQDLTYGEHGLVHLRFGNTPYQFLPGSDPTGNATIVSMSADGESFSLRRFSAGVPDPSAGPDGTIITVPLPFDPGEGARAQPYRMWNLSGGRMVIEFVVPRGRKGQVFTETGDSYFVRLNPDRTLDTTYGTNGSIQFVGRFWHEVAQQGDKLVARQDTEPNRLLRYDADGQLDTTFGNAGRDVLSDRINALIAQPDGKLLVGMQFEHTVHRRNVDGGPDTTFGGGDGIAPDAGLDALYELGLDGSGRIIGLGSGMLERLTPDGQVDVTFGNNGVVPFEMPDFRGSVLVEGLGIVPLTEFGFDEFIRVDAAGNRDVAYGRISVDLRRAFPRDPAINGALEPQEFIAQPDGSVLVRQRIMDGRFVQARIAGGGSAPPSIAVDAGSLTVTGTDGNDRIEVGELVGTFSAWLNGVGRVFASAGVLTYRVDAHAGNDIVTIFSHSPSVPAVVHGGVGDDRLTGDGGADSLYGNAGNDRIDGGRGDDRLDGNGGRDKLAGGYGDGRLAGTHDGNDRLFGGDGDDWLNGGSDDDLLFGHLGNDYLDGGVGRDRLMGSDGNDVFVSADLGGPVLDDLYGGGGTDTLVAGDAVDLLTDIETT